MHNTKSTTAQWRSIFLALFFAGIGVAAWSQEDPDKGEAEPEAAPAAKQTTTKPAADKKPSPSNNNNSPFDYQASEEISQDLSVSWPVDI